MAWWVPSERMLRVNGTDDNGNMKSYCFDYVGYCYFFDKKSNQGHVRTKHRSLKDKIELQILWN